jgi:hypothetical protein
MALKVNEPRRHRAACQQRAANRNAENRRAEPQQNRDFNDEQDNPRKRERRQISVPGHGRGNEALDQVLAPGIDDGKTHPPDRASHEIHAEQTGNQEIDVARTRLAHREIARSHWIGAARGLLDSLFGEHARGASFGIGVVIAVGHFAMRARRDEQGHFAGAQGLFAGGRVHLAYIEKFFAPQRICQPGRDGGDPEHFRGTIAKGQTQARG